ncbi:MAG: hypothetical protein JSV33_14330 [bacterium]|nr:MAG: hypothetical protein JSV33_14330 [bacterium]
MRSVLKSIAFAVIAALLASCTSDQEGPVAGVFVEEGLIGIERDTLAVSVRTVPVPTGVGTGKLLQIGEIKGIHFEALLMAFDFTLEGGLGGRTVTAAILDLPVVAATPEDTLIKPEDFLLRVSFHELLAEFEETDSITAVPGVDAVPIPDSLGETVHGLGITSFEFSLSPAFVQEWLEGTRPHRGIAILLAEEPDPTGLMEMKARELGSDPPVMRVAFDDTTADTFAVSKDYAVATFSGDGIDCVAGVAQRIFFEFDPGDDLDSVVVHYAALVLTVDGERGLGATRGESSPSPLPELPSDFPYYLYTPNSADPEDPAFLDGTGVDVGTFLPYETQVLEIPLRGFMPDVVRGLRVNTGLVFQSNIETLRIQRATFFSAGEDGQQGPYIEVIYSYPAEFSGSS